MLKKTCLFPCLCFLLALSFSCRGQKQMEPLSVEPSETHHYGESDIVNASILDKNGDLWFATIDEGVYKYDGVIFTQFTTNNGLCDNEVWSILEGTDGNIWFGTGKGLCKYDGNTFLSIPTPWDGTNDIWGVMCNPNLIMALHQDSAGNIWLGTCGGGAYRYDGQNFTSFLADRGRKQADSLHHNLIKSITEDEAGNLWFTSLTHGGVSRYDGNDFTHFTEKEGLRDDMVFCSMRDQAGDLWFGCIQTKGGGLYRYEVATNHFTNFSQADGLCDNFIFNLYQDKNGKIWISTGKGICTYDGTSFTSAFTSKEHGIQEVRFFVEDKQGHLWFGGRYGNLWRYDGKALMDFTQRKRVK